MYVQCGNCDFKTNSNHTFQAWNVTTNSLLSNIVDRGHTWLYTKVMYAATTKTLCPKTTTYSYVVTISILGFACVDTQIHITLIEHYSPSEWAFLLRNTFGSESKDNQKPRKRLTMSTLFSRRCDLSATSRQTKLWAPRCPFPLLVICGQTTTQT